jgi:primase-polymerase (primpol)-like protein
MNGDTSEYGGDHSRADLALCNLIAFYSQGCGDLIDAVFRRSSLLRAKWGEKHDRGGRTYGEMTVAKALEGRREFYDWDPITRVTKKV